MIRHATGSLWRSIATPDLSDTLMLSKLMLAAGIAAMIGSQFIAKVTPLKLVLLAFDIKL